MLSTYIFREHIILLHLSDLRPLKFFCCLVGQLPSDGLLFNLWCQEQAEPWKQVLMESVSVTAAADVQMFLQWNHELVILIFSWKSWNLFEATTQDARPLGGCFGTPLGFKILRLKSFLTVSAVTKSMVWIKCNVFFFFLRLMIPPVLPLHFPTFILNLNENTISLKTLVSCLNFYFNTDSFIILSSDKTIRLKVNFSVHLSPYHQSSDSRRASSLIWG